MEPGPGPDGKSDPGARAALARDVAIDSFQRPWRAQLWSLIGWLVAVTLAVVICDWAVPGFHTELALGTGPVRRRARAWSGCSCSRSWWPVR